MLTPMAGTIWGSVMLKNCWRRFAPSTAACVESCVGGARVIGDLNDAQSSASQMLKDNAEDIKVLKPGMATAPHVFYIGLPDEFVNGIEGQASVRLVAGH